jgi:hypothetical protein
MNHEEHDANVLIDKEGPGSPLEKLVIDGHLDSEFMIIYGRLI